MKAAAVALFLLLFPLCARSESKSIEHLRQSYEGFFTSRYSLEQEFPYRLISVRGQLVEYTPQTNILAPISSFGPSEIIDTKQIKGSLLNAFAPLMYSISTGEEAKIDALAVARQIASRALDNLYDLRKESFSELLQRSPDNKISYCIFLTPYRKTDANLFYGKQKISMVRSGQVTLRQKNGDNIQEHIAKEIDLLRAFLFYNRSPKETAPSLLAARIHFTADVNEAVLNSDILLNLYPQNIPYEETKNSISFSNIVVPSGKKFRLPTVLISIKTFLNHPRQPTMTLTFGNFSTVKNHQFVMGKDKDHRYAPYLLGSVQKFKPLHVKFQFRKIDLSLQTFTAENVHMIFSPGFKIGSLLIADLGKFRVEKVDREFKASINAELDKTKDKITGQILSDPRIVNLLGSNIVDGLRKLFALQKKTND